MTNRPDISYISWGLYFAPENGADPYGFCEFFGIPPKDGAFLNLVYAKAQQSRGDAPGNDWYPLLPEKSGLARTVAFKSLADFGGDADDLMKWLETKFSEACEQVRSSGE
jgi:hypothetical protein